MWQQASGRVVTIDNDAEYARSVMRRLPAGAAVESFVADLTGQALPVGPGLNYGTLPLALATPSTSSSSTGGDDWSCLLTAFALSGPATIVLLHDYRRDRYRLATVCSDSGEGQQFMVLRARPELLALTAATGAARRFPRGRSAFTDLPVGCI